MVNYHHNKTGRGGAVIKIKAKNMDSGAITEKTFRPGDKVKAAHIETQNVQFLYRNGDMAVFMNVKDYEQIELGEDVLGDTKYYLAENAEFLLNIYKEKVIAVTPPVNMVMTIAQTDPGVRGDTVSNVTKPATTETGLTLQVPLFINQGQKIKVDTRTGEYVERA